MFSTGAGRFLQCYTFSDEAPVRLPFIRGVVT